MRTLAYAVPGRGLPVFALTAANILAVNLDGFQKYAFHAHPLIQLRFSSRGMEMSAWHIFPFIIQRYSSLNPPSASWTNSSGNRDQTRASRSCGRRATAVAGLPTTRIFAWFASSILSWIELPFQHPMTDERAQGQQDHISGSKNEGI